MIQWDTPADFVLFAWRAFVFIALCYTWRLAHNIYERLRWIQKDILPMMQKWHEDNPKWEKKTVHVERAY